MRGVNSMRKKPKKPRPLVEQPEMTVDFYNENIGSSELVEPEESNWHGVYRLALNFLPPADQDPTIMDVGCGTGMFARLLFKQGYKNYLGFDFARNRVAIARVSVPKFQFFVGDVYDVKKLKPVYRDFDNFIILEVLEHLTEDLKILESIPRGKTIIFSVPNYLSPSHVRAFHTVNMIENRYKGLVEFLEIASFIGSKTRHRNAYGVSKNYRSEIFVCKCIKR